MLASGHRPVRFVVFSTPRTGSSWLVELLDAHPRVVCYGERFYPGRGVRHENGSTDFVRFDDLPTRFMRRSRPAAALELEAYVALLLRKREGMQAVGLKVMLEQAQARTTLMATLRRRRTRVVHLVRENTLARLISLRAAIARGVFRARLGDTVSTPSVRLERAKLVYDLEAMEDAVIRSRELITRHGLACHELTYEGLLGDTRGALARIAAFLDLDETTWDPSSTLVVTNPDPLSLVENLDEVAGELFGTRFEWMLEASTRATASSTPAST